MSNVNRFSGEVFATAEPFWGSNKGTVGDKLGFKLVDPSDVDENGKATVHGFRTLALAKQAQISNPTLEPSAIIFDVLGGKYPSKRTVVDKSVVSDAILKTVGKGKILRLKVIEDEPSDQYGRQFSWKFIEKIGKKDVELRNAVLSMKPFPFNDEAINVEPVVEKPSKDKTKKDKLVDQGLN